MKKKLTAIFILIIIAAIPRLIFLDRVPAGISNDELDFVLNAKPIFYHFTDITGTWNPLSLRPLPYAQPKGELPALLLGPFIGPVPYSLLFARLPFALLSIALVILLFLIARKLFSSDSIGFFCGLVLALNPLAIYFGRTAYDGPLAVFFYTLGITGLFYLRGRKILLAFIPFFVAFFCYIGTKLILLPIVFVTAFYAWHFISKRHYGKYYLTFCFGAVALFIYFVLILSRQSVLSRSGDLLTPTHSQIVSSATYARQVALLTPLRYIFSNNYSVFLRESINRVIAGFSPEILFTKGEPTTLFFIPDHGVFYYFEIIFLIVGLIVISRRYHKEGIFILSVLFASLIPAILSSVDISYVHRSFLGYVFLSLIIGLGLSTVIDYLRSKPHQRIFSFVILLAYFFGFLNFAYIYLYRNPVARSSEFFTSYHVLSRYIHEETSKGKKVMVAGVEGQTKLRQYVFYNNLYSPQNDELAKVFKSQDDTYHGVSFTDCRNLLPGPNTTLIIESVSTCNNISLPKEYISISELSDNGEKFKIYNDSSCNQYGLDPFISKLTLADLAIDKLSSRDFCMKFMTNSNRLRP